MSGAASGLDYDGWYLVTRQPPRPWVDFLVLQHKFQPRIADAQLLPFKAELIWVDDYRHLLVGVDFPFQ